jgi:membrane protein implicated in regulation of membrane protease activity
MLWWYWLLLGLALLGLEIATPGAFYFLFPGAAALLVGGLSLVGLAGPDWAQWALFSVLSVGLLALARKPLVAKLKIRRSHEDRLPEIVGEQVTLLEDLRPGEVGKGELRGSTWNVRSGVQATLHREQRCRVQRVDGLTLWVLPE